MIDKVVEFLHCDLFDQFEVSDHINWPIEFKHAEKSENFGGLSRELQVSFYLLGVWKFLIHVSEYLQNRFSHQIGVSNESQSRDSSPVFNILPLKIITIQIDQVVKGWTDQTRQNYRQHFCSLNMETFNRLNELIITSLWKYKKYAFISWHFP